MEINKKMGKQLLTRLNAQGIKTLDLLPAMQKSEEKLFWDEDYHLNPAGHALLAHIFFSTWPSNNIAVIERQIHALYGHVGVGHSSTLYKTRHVMVLFTYMRSEADCVWESRFNQQARDGETHHALNSCEAIP